MILDFLLTHRGEFVRSPDREGLLATQRAMATARTVLSDPSAVHAVLLGSLAGSVLATGSREPEGTRVARLAEIPLPRAAEAARLLSKGRVLYEHCMAEISSACVIGFFDHELTKSATARGVVFELLGWILERRLELSLEGGPDDEDTDARLRHTDWMLDLGASLLHGVPRTRAVELARLREP